MSQTRVLQVFDKMDRGGAETFIMNIYRNIDRDKIQFDFIVYGDEKGDYDDEINSLGGKIYHLPKFNGFNYFVFNRAWNAFFNNHREYKVIHGHAQGTAGIYLKCAKKHGLYTIAHSHNTYFGSGIKKIVKSFFQMKIVKYADTLYACSEKAAQALYGAKASQAQVIYNSVDLKYLMSKELDVKSEYNLKGKFVIGHVGRFVYEKNHKFMIEIMKRVVTKNKNAVLLFIGRGNLEEEIKSLVKKNNLEKNVIFMGVRSDVLKILKAMDIFILPSIAEGLPLSAVEAQAAGLKCLVSDSLPSDVKISSYLKFLDINDINIWVDEILKSNDFKQEFYENLNNFDVDLSSQILSKKYLSI